MPTLNLGILAHVDAGKTTLTERLLNESGATRYLGRVDHGDTVTDADEIERRRGITIRTAVATMQVRSSIGPVTVNLIDTPGHPDFVAEVERALGVLDGAVLVVSAVEGVQAQTRVLVRTLERMALPFLVFLNKVDRAAASIEDAMAALRQLLSNVPVPMTRLLQAADVVDAVSSWDEQLLHEYVEEVEPPSQERLFAAVAEQARLGHVHPVFAGSALHGLGVRDFLTALPDLLPVVQESGGSAPHATVFRIDRDAAGQRLAYVRVHEGRLSPRDQVSVHRRGRTGQVTVRQARALDVRVFTRGAETRSDVASAGAVAIVVGLGDIAVGDQLGAWDPIHAGRHFRNPGLEAVVEPRDLGQRLRLFEALRQLGEQDPLIDVRLDGPDQDVTVSLYGEVQKQVLATRLAEEYGVAPNFLPTRVVCIERVAGTGEGEAVAKLGNARVGFLVGAAAVGTGLDYDLASTVEKGWLLPQYHHAIEEQLSKELDRGLHGWRLTDLLVRTIASRWAAPVPSPSDFREVAHLAFRRALASAGTVVCAPVSRFHVEVPTTDLSRVLSLVTDLGGTPGTVRSEAFGRIDGTLPTTHVAALEQRLPGCTGGRGIVWTEPAGHVPVDASATFHVRS